jgi:hypothetical protein
MMPARYVWVFSFIHEEGLLVNRLEDGGTFYW